MARAVSCCSCPVVPLQVMRPHVDFHAHCCTHANANILILVTYILIYGMVLKRVGLGEGLGERQGWEGGVGGGQRIWEEQAKVDWGCKQCSAVNAALHCAVQCCAVWSGVVSNVRCGPNSGSTHHPTWSWHSLT